MEIKIGERLKRLRLASNLTQEELANRTNLTKGYISQLERDNTSPSLATLGDILEVLGINLADFFKESPQEQTVFKCSNRKLLADSTEEARVELLIYASQRQEMEPVLVTLAPGAKTREDRQHQGEEFGFILTGKAMLRLGRQGYELEEGDCFYFSADRRHFLQNIGDTEAKILWVVTPPTF